jgi:hypothetical protein
MVSKYERQEVSTLKVSTNRVPVPSRGVYIQHFRCVGPGLRGVPRGKTLSAKGKQLILQNESEKIHERIQY